MITDRLKSSISSHMSTIKEIIITAGNAREGKAVAKNIGKCDLGAAEIENQGGACGASSPLGWIEESSQNTALFLQRSRTILSARSDFKLPRIGGHSKLPQLDLL